jgi:glycosyltransferase involved in cell wall biosynthesis
LSKNFKVVNTHIDELEFDVVVGMAVYSEDRLDWVEQAVASILQQTYEGYLFAIVIDGGICEEVFALLIDISRQSNRVTLMKGERNMGLSSCMNYLIDWSMQYKAKYFFRMDADDISASNRITTQVEYLNRHSNISILGSALVEVNEQGTPVGKRKLPLKHDEIIRFLPKRCSINHPTVAIRYNVFDEGHRYRNDLKNTQDYFMWAELAAAGFQFANLRQQLLSFRRVNDFYKRRALNKSINEFKARLFTMKILRAYSIGNLVYAFAVLSLRLMPSIVVKFAYKIDRLILEKLVKH